MALSKTLVFDNCAFYVVEVKQLYINLPDTCYTIPDTTNS